MEEKQTLLEHGLRKSIETITQEVFSTRPYNKELKTAINNFIVLSKTDPAKAMQIVNELERKTTAQLEAKQSISKTLTPEQFTALKDFVNHLTEALAKGVDFGTVAEQIEPDLKNIEQSGLLRVLLYLLKLQENQQRLILDFLKSLIQTFTEELNSEKPNPEVDEVYLVKKTLDKQIETLKEQAKKEDRSLKEIVRLLSNIGFTFILYMFLQPLMSISNKINNSIAVKIDPLFKDTQIGLNLHLISTKLVLITGKAVATMFPNSFWDKHPQYKENVEKTMNSTIEEIKITRQKLQNMAMAR